MEVKGRLLVVANRLPITIKQNDSGTYDFSMSSGGLVSGLKGLSKAVDFRWFGWPGIDVHRNDQAELRRQLNEQFGAVPVFIPKDLSEKHYDGFSNSVLWPLLHRMPEKSRSDVPWNGAYQKVNDMFADALVPYVENGDTIWIHDYHLLLLPAALRKALGDKKDVKIGMFLHTPFPSEDYFSILPFREAICDGLLSCDLVGFHIDEYAKDFLDSATRVLKGVERSPSDLHYEGRHLIVHSFPIGIDPAEFKQKLESEATQKEIKILKEEFRGKKVLIGVDRLDYIKGIPQKLLAFDKFLTDNPEWVGKVVLIQLAIPTRPTVEEYIKLRREVESLVGNINGKHGTFTYAPILYMYQTLPPEKLCALYEVADACLISSIRDGLNMVSYEYVACQRKRKGVLVMSQYTGAAKMLPSSVLVNPWDTPRFAETIAKVLTMPMEERAKRQDAAAEVVDKWTSIKWGKSFLETLATMKIQREEPRRTHPENLNKNAETEKAIEAGSDVVEEYKDSSLTNGH